VFDPMSSAEQRPQVVIAGGGIAGIEALLAVRDLAGDRADLTLLARDPEFTYKPMIVEEPFTSQPAQRAELRPLLDSVGGRFVAGALSRVDPDGRTVSVADSVDLGGDGELSYDYLVVCLGGRPTPAYERVLTFSAAGPELSVDSLLDEAEQHPSARLAFVVPPGVSWSLPLYELALMTRRRAEESGRGGLELSLITPESAPLVLFGRTASDAVAELLAARRIDFEGSTHVAETRDGSLVRMPGERPLDAGAVIALPVLEGARPPGLPSDEHGFIPIDAHARVKGLDDVYAAGDGTSFPIKQGGLGTQQADAAAGHIAARLGAPVEAEVFHPVLRGQLITAGESLHLRHDLTGGHGEGMVSADYLWWPPHKVGGRYLAPWLAHEKPGTDLEPPSHPLDVEISLPHEWHEDPMALDPYSAPQVD
jgi:sulfide:quinone oxidoreductase